MTGQTEEFFEKWREEWDEIVTAHMPKVEELLYDAEENADKYRFKKANQVLVHIDDLLTAAESSIEKILREISDLVTSEEKSREEIEQVRERYSKSRKTCWLTATFTGSFMTALKRIWTKFGAASNNLKKKQKAETILLHEKYCLSRTAILNGFSHT